MTPHPNLKGDRRLLRAEEHQYGIGQKIMQIVWSKHAQERQQQWQNRLEITRAEVETVLLNPQQTVVEDDVLVAQSRRGNGLLRVVFVEIGQTKRILTLYWTNQVDRYWQEKTDER